MIVKHGSGRSEFGPHGVCIRGPRTIRVNGARCEEGNVYVDPSGYVIDNGRKWSGRGGDE